MKTKVEVIQADDEPEVAAKILAQSIRDIALAANALLRAGLKRKTLLVLLKDATGVPQRDIELILNAQQDLARLYLEKP